MFTSSSRKHLHPTATAVLQKCSDIRNLWTSYPGFVCSCSSPSMASLTPGCARSPRATRSSGAASSVPVSEMKMRC
eukprot:6828928-Prymnesium_polylepis.1